MINEKVAHGRGRHRLFVYNAGFLTQPRIRRILELSGWDVSLGAPSDGDWVGIWGQSPTAWRGEAVAEASDAPLLSVEDAFLRSVHPGRLKSEAPIGLCLDRLGPHFDPDTPSDLETILSENALDDTALLNRARRAIEQLKYWHLGKYSATDPALAVPDPGYVVVIDQTRDDAALGPATDADFREMLVIAQEENPGCPILIKSHPETVNGARAGHFSEDDETDRVHVLSEPVSPWTLFDGAVAVYTMSSTLGFEAIFAGHKPRVFGQPFYAGWGLTQDETPVPRRERVLTRAQLFAAAMIIYPVWYDATRDQICEIEDVIADLAARTRAWRADRHGYLASGMRMWKRPHLQRFFGGEIPLKFSGAVGTRRPMVWGRPDIAPTDCVFIEDGFLRSRGLGSELTPPLSLVQDETGIYYDARSASDLERLIAKSTELPLAEIERASRFRSAISRDNLTKYNITGNKMPDLPQGHKILIVGQVEDDASVILGTGEWATNLSLIEKTRAENPDSILMWKPHPDVEAGLRIGAVEADKLSDLVDVTLEKVSASDAMASADEVWTMTSTMGFEALLRGIPVVTLGMPFYAGWGLTRDFIVAPERRGPGPTLDGLAHACLIGYPRYFHPVTGDPISPESAAHFLKSDAYPAPARNRFLAKLQGMFASQAHLWRR